MVFLGVYRVLYDYPARAKGELTIKEGDLLFVLDKASDDDWWKAKKKAQSDEEDEPEGLIPNNYVEEFVPILQAKALYDYTRQTDEELSFAEDAILDVYDTSDPDWTLVGSRGEYGFAPAIYIEAVDSAAAAPVMPTRPRAVDPEPEYDEPPTPSSSETPTQSPAVALAGILGRRTAQSSGAASRTPISAPHSSLPSRLAQLTPEASDEDRAALNLPRRPPLEQVSPPRLHPRTVRSPSPIAMQTSLSNNRAVSAYNEDSAKHSPGGFHLYNIHEMIKYAGKSRKMPITLGINVSKGIVSISPEKSSDGPLKEWTAEKMTHYSIEGKHVFMELVKPCRSVDFHAGAKDTAQEILSSLAEIAAAPRAVGLREVVAAGSGHQTTTGKILYEFTAQGDDEVTVAADDEVIVLDDTKSREWWVVKRLKTGKEGVVPSRYVEITGVLSGSPQKASSFNAGPSHVEQNRLEEERLAKQAAKMSRRIDDGAVEVGPGLSLPKRMSSLSPGLAETRNSQRAKRDSSSAKTAGSKSKPDTSRIRIWTDRSGAFKVEAEYIGLRDGKIHLHKTNGVKIAVPITKMAIEDIEYVERVAGVSLDDDKPLAYLQRSNARRTGEASKAGISVEHPKKPEYDWFDFFLQAGVSPQICARYATAFSKDEMREEDMESISASLCRTLGLKEGDILRVMKFLDNKFGRPRTVEGAASNGGLFSGAGGALKNNTGRGRPSAPSRSASGNVVDADAFKQSSGGEKTAPADSQRTPIAGAPEHPRRLSTGFEDNAWEPRKVKQPAATASPASLAAVPPAPAPVQRPTPTGAAFDLSTLSAPLQPTPAPAPILPIPQEIGLAMASQPPPPQGATPSLFEQLAKANPQQPTNLNAQQTGFQPQQQLQLPRQRPTAPQQTVSMSGLAPPPQRAASVPNQGGFHPPPLQPQLTGYNPQFQQIAPPGQSLQDLRQQTLQQQFIQQQQQQQSGFGGRFQNGIMPQPTGFGQVHLGFQPQPTTVLGQPVLHQPSLQQRYLNGQMASSPFADPSAGQPYQPILPQLTGYGQFQQMQPAPTGINAFLPPALTPQRTGVFSQNNQFGQPPQTLQMQQQHQMPPIPPIPQQQVPAPLVPQKTGPPPPVRFGTQPATKKLMAQPTGRRANLSQATPQNPFGF